MEKSSEEQGIREAIAHYVDGMRTGNVERLKRGFHEQAILCGYLGDELIAAPIAALYRVGRCQSVAERNRRTVRL